MNKYCILNETNLRLKLDNLKKPIAHFDGIYVSYSQNAQIELIEELLSQSTPLIPEIEKAFDAGKDYGYDLGESNYIGCNRDTTIFDKQDYITNLKHNI